MPNLLYSHPADNVAALATLTCDAGTPEAIYPVSALVDLNPAKPCKLAETSGSFLWEFSSAQRVDLVAIIHHNLTAGLSVKVQANDTDDWLGSPGPALETTITIPAWWPDGMPVNPFKDLTGEAGYSTGGYTYWRLLIDGSNANPIAIGDVMLLSEKRHMAENPVWGIGRGEDRPIIEHVTDYLVSTVYSYGISRRRLTGTLVTSPTGADELRAWWRACGGRAVPFFFEIDGGETNDGWLARFAMPALDLTHDGPNLYRGQLAFDEVARGLPL